MLILDVNAHYLTNDYESLTWEFNFFEQFALHRSRCFGNERCADNVRCTFRQARMSVFVIAMGLVCGRDIHCFLQRKRDDGDTEFSCFADISEAIFFFVYV